MECPACKSPVSDSDNRCRSCNYGIRMLEPRARYVDPHRPPRRQYIGDKGDRDERNLPLPSEKHDEKLARTYRCPNCRSYGADVRRIATTGAGFTRLMNWQIHEFIVANCHYCGLIQQFDPRVVDKTRGGWKALDFLFEI